MRKSSVVGLLTFILIIEIVGLLFVFQWFGISPDSNALKLAPDNLPKDVVVVEEVLNSPFEPEDLRWEEFPVRYMIINPDSCGEFEVNEIKRAFAELKKATNGLLNFERASDGELDKGITLSCSFIEDCYSITEEAGVTTESICSYQRGGARISGIENGYITSVEIELVGLYGFSETGRKYGEVSGFAVGGCGYPVVAIHEIGHAMGLGHSSEANRIMSPLTEGESYYVYTSARCEGAISEIDEEMAGALLGLYLPSSFAGRVVEPLVESSDMQPGILGLILIIMGLIGLTIAIIVQILGSRGPKIKAVHALR